MPGQAAVSAGDSRHSQTAGVLTLFPGPVAGGSFQTREYLGGLPMPEWSPPASVGPSSHGAEPKLEAVELWHEIKGR